MQTHKESIIEAIANTGSGVVISWLLTMWMFRTDAAQSLNIVMVYTAVSVARSYFWRRIFNKKQSRKGVI